MTPPLELAFHALDRLRGDGLTASLAKLQRKIEGSVGNSGQGYLEDAEAVLMGALALKSARRRSTTWYMLPACLRCYQRFSRKENASRKFASPLAQADESLIFVLTVV